MRLKLTSQGILLYLWSAELSFLNIFSNTFTWWEGMGLPHISYIVIHELWSIPTRCCQEWLIISKENLFTDVREFLGLANVLKPFLSCFMIFSCKIFLNQIDFDSPHTLMFLSPENHIYCVKSICIRNYSSRHSSGFGINTVRYSRNAGKCGPE